MTIYGKMTLVSLALLITVGLAFPGVSTANDQMSPKQTAQAPVNKESNSKHAERFRIGHTIYIIDQRRPAFQHLTNLQIRTDLQQLRLQTLKDVRRERAENVSTSIRPDRKLDRLATLRAKQVAKHFSHYNRDHKPMTTVDAPKVGLPHGFQASENIASSSLGNCTIVADPKTYHNHNGRDMANMSNDGMMNYDEFERNGHRKNILNSDSSLIGIGAAYSPRKHTFYLAEDFGDENPRSSSDVNRSRIHFRLKTRRSVTFKLLWNRSVRWLQKTLPKVARDVKNKF